MNFELVILNGGRNLDPLNDNVDVEIKLIDGRIFSATFFTLENLKSLLSEYRITGECANGLYIWASDMIVINKLSETNIRNAVQDLIKNNEITKACTEIALKTH